MPCVWLSDGTILNVKPEAMKDKEFVRELKNIEKRIKMSLKLETARSQKKKSDTK